MRVLRFQQKPSENRIGIMIDSARFAELGTSKNSEPILEFLQDLKREAKANQTLEAAKKQIVDSGEKNPKGVFNLDKVTVLPPISHPTKIICMGGNFSDHLQEGSTSLPPFPISFLKSPTSLVGHRAPVFYPRRVKLLDYEVELAAVIGKRCKDVSKKNALDHIAGFSVFNDISARDIQFAEMKRGFCNLGMELRVNGQTRQFSSTKNMVFKIIQLVEFFSSMTLEPGDIITSGTPSGVAIYRKPDKTPFLLQPGDMIESKIENLGRLQNTVLAETSPVKAAFLGKPQTIA